MSRSVREEFNTKFVLLLSVYDLIVDDLKSHFKQ